MDPQDIFIMPGHPKGAFSMMIEQPQKDLTMLTQRMMRQSRQVTKLATAVSTHAQACVQRDCFFPGCGEYKTETHKMENCQCSPKYPSDVMGHSSDCSQGLYWRRVLGHAKTCSFKFCSLYLCTIRRSDAYKDVPLLDDEDKDFQEVDPEQNESMDWEDVYSGYGTEKQGSPDPGHSLLVSNCRDPFLPYRKQTSLFGRNGIQSEFKRNEQVKKPRMPTLHKKLRALQPFLSESTQKEISDSMSMDFNSASPDERSAFSVSRNTAPASKTLSSSMSSSPQLPRDMGETNTSEFPSLFRYPDVPCLQQEHPWYCPSYDSRNSSPSDVTEVSDNGAQSPTYSPSPPNPIFEALQSTERASQFSPRKRLFADDFYQPGSQYPHSDGSADSGCFSPEGQDPWSSQEDGSSSPEYHPRSWSRRPSFQADGHQLWKRERFQTARSPSGLDQRSDKHQRYRGMSSQSWQSDGGRGLYDAGSRSSYAKGACSGITDMRRSPGRVNRSSYGQSYGQDAFQEENRQHPQYESFSLHRGTPAASPGIFTGYRLHASYMSDSSEEYDSGEEHDSGEEYPQHPESEHFQPMDGGFHQLINTDDSPSGNNADFEDVNDGDPQARSNNRSPFPDVDQQPAPPTACQLSACATCSPAALSSIEGHAYVWARRDVTGSFSTDESSGEEMEDEDSDTGPQDQIPMSDSED